jgi:antitoxin ParD1/3/4
VRFVAQIEATDRRTYDAWMRTTMNVSLPADLRDWVSEQVRSGGYGTASEYLRDLLRRARDRQVRQRIDASLVEAVESGAKIVMDDKDWTSIRKAARLQAARSHGARSGAGRTSRKKR